jgi:hypothetical protein
MKFTARLPPFELIQLGPPPSTAYFTHGWSTAFLLSGSRQRRQQLSLPLRIPHS